MGELDATSVPVTRIAPGQGGVLASLAECWCRREILYFLAWRDIKVRYKQTVLGMAWAILQPLAMMLISTLVFNRMAGINTDIPYPVYVFAGLLPWQLFQSALVRSSESIVASAHLLTKVYFPRLLVPLSTVVSGLVDFAVSLVILAVLMAHYGLRPGWAVLWLPVFVLLAVLSALSVGIWLSALNAKYRDFRYVVPFLASAWMFLSPVMYPATSLLPKLPRAAQWLYNLNPMTGVLEGFRWACLGGSTAALAVLPVSVGALLVVFVGGLFVFRRIERDFADLL